MKMSRILDFIFITACFLTDSLMAGSIHGIKRSKCEHINSSQDRESIEPNIFQKRLNLLRNEMEIRTLIDAYIVTNYDEHQAYQSDDVDSRLTFISGFSGPVGDVVITLRSAALWTDAKYLELADQELNCEWKIFIMGENPTIAEWLAKQIPTDASVGVDPATTPHHLWNEWDRELSREFFKITKVKNLIDFMWGSERISPRNFSIRTLNSTFTGSSWQNKTETLKGHLREHRCDAMIVSSLTEIAYLLNLRGKDYRYVPVFKAYLIVTHEKIILYTNISRVPLEAELMLKFDFRTNSCYQSECVIIKNYDEFWHDLRALSHRWKRVLLPTMNVFDMGTSEAVYSMFNKENILEKPSPIIYMRAQKNEVERIGMRSAHLRDAVAMCDALSYMDERYLSGDRWKEYKLAIEIDRARYEQSKVEGLAFKTIAAFGKNAAKPYYDTKNESETIINDENFFLIDSGGQYLDGTTSIARTLHLGEPTTEQKKAYTSVLTGLIRLSMLVFPDNLRPADIDTLIRGPLWSSRHDYEHLSGHGIGSYLSVEESPINIAYTTKHKYVFKEGYFFTVAPGYYKANDYGIRLKNVFEVIDTHDKHFTGAKFLTLQVTTLVPFESKLIDKTLLSLQEKKWLNNYNAQIRETVGAELKRQLKMQAFYWLVNQTHHIREYLTESEYRKNASSQLTINYLLILIIVLYKALLIEIA